MGIGLAALTVELALDFARSFTEYWSQKKYGITPDGVACAYGQDRPIWARFSTIEVYQKVAGYVLFPGSLGTEKQIFTSIQGALGSIWRIFPQTFVIVPLIGTKIDRALEKVAKLTHLNQIATRIESKYGKERDEAKGMLDEAIASYK